MASAFACQEHSSASVAELRLCATSESDGPAQPASRRPGILSAPVEESHLCQLKFSHLMAGIVVRWGSDLARSTTEAGGRLTCLIPLLLPAGAIRDSAFRSPGRAGLKSPRPRECRTLHVQRFAGNFLDGASRTRTGGLLGAIQALSQLSYSPEGRPMVAAAPCTRRPAAALGREAHRAVTRVHAAPPQPSQSSSKPPGHPRCPLSAPRGAARGRSGRAVNTAQQGPVVEPITELRRSVEAPAIPAGMREQGDLVGADPCPRSGSRRRLALRG